MTRFGFYDDKLSKIDVYLVPFGFAYGWQNYGSSGDICIPAISTSRLSEIFGYPILGLHSILRHEFAHAISDTHRGLLHSKVFTNAFGNNHDSHKENPLYYYISDYAMTNTSESFAEVFMFYLKHKGNLSAIFSSPPLAPPPIRRQWRFIRRLAVAIQQGKSRW